METDKPEEGSWVNDLLQSLQEMLVLLKNADIAAKDTSRQDNNREVRHLIQEAESICLNTYTTTVEYFATTMETKIADAKNEGENEQEGNP